MALTTTVSQDPASHRSSAPTQTGLWPPRWRRRAERVDGEPPTDDTMLIPPVAAPHSPGQATPPDANGGPAPLYDVPPPTDIALNVIGECAHVHRGRWNSQRLRAALEEHLRELEWRAGREREAEETYLRRTMRAAQQAEAMGDVLDRMSTSRMVPTNTDVATGFANQMAHTMASGVVHAHRPDEPTGVGDIPPVPSHEEDPHDTSEPVAAPPPPQSNSTDPPFHASDLCIGDEAEYSDHFGSTRFTVKNVDADDHIVRVGDTRGAAYMFTLGTPLRLIDRPDMPLASPALLTPVPSPRTAPPAPTDIPNGADASGGAA